MHYYQFNIGDYIKHTTHLSNDEDLCYRRLLDLYYDTEQPIPNNIPWVSRRLRMGSDVVETILKEYFVCTDEGYKNPRADQEIADYHAFLTKQRNNGKLGGRPKKTHRKPTANPSLTQTEPKKTLNTNHKTENNISTPEGVPDDLWKEWIAMRKKQKAPVTDRVINSIKKESEKAGITLADAMQKMMIRGWRGFEAQWVTDKQPTQGMSTAELERSLFK